MLEKTVTSNIDSATSTPSPSKFISLLPLGDAAWTVEFGDKIDPTLHAKVLGLAAALEKAQKKVGDTDYSGVVDVVPTFRSLTVHYNPLITDGARLGASLSRLAESAGTADSHGRHWRIPVCFDDEYALDLNDLAESKKMSREAVISLMTETTFQVYMIGFMPGFPYMGGLPSVLEAPRLASPRKAVPARSLAVAGSMCAVYPWESPGGWRLLGRTPIPMFSVSHAGSPSLFASGDRVCWQAIDRSLFLEMETEALAGNLDRKAFLVPQGEA
ncbi:MAG: 5-oxoprolinase subunit PxpB [Betaproteobacteria bacterium]